MKDISFIPYAICRRFPDARAIVRGGSEYPEICGTVSFYQIDGAVIVTAEFTSLPDMPGENGRPIFAFHIHEGESCEDGAGSGAFPLSGGHYNPQSFPHPRHSGDMPPLFGCNGMAWMAFLTDRFSVSDVIGRVVIVHSHPDDFTTQPSGGSGDKIACGVIKPVC